MGARCLALYPWKAGLYPRKAVHLVPCVCGRSTEGGLLWEEDYHGMTTTGGLLWEEDYRGMTIVGGLPPEEYLPPRATGHSWLSSLHFLLELPQVEVTKAYFAKQADEITLQQADVVLVLQEEDGECGWGHPDWANQIWLQSLLGCGNQHTFGLPHPS